MSVFSGNCLFSETSFVCILFSELFVHLSFAYFTMVTIVLLILVVSVVLVIAVVVSLSFVQCLPGFAVYLRERDCH